MARYKLGEPIQINDFTTVCGAFVGDFCGCRHGGYHCVHPENGSGGECRHSACPLAYALYADDQADVDILAKAFSLTEEEASAWLVDEQWLVPYRLPLKDELVPALAQWADDGGPA